MEEILDKWASVIVDGVMDDIADGLETNSVENTRKRLDHMLEDIHRNSMARCYSPNLTTKEAQ